MTVQELRALLVNVTDDLPVYFIREGMYVPLNEEDIELVAFDGGTYIGPTALVIFTDDEHTRESEDKTVSSEGTA